MVFWILASMDNPVLFLPCWKGESASKYPPVFSRQSFSSDSTGSDSGITSREGWCTTDAVNRKEMSVL